MTLQPSESKRKHEEIADSLARDILVGQYRCGERLPSERDLAVRFDANRGAVREAMKKLEQLGVAHIQPGGARVAPLNEASLDVIGYLLALNSVPDRDLVDQILAVISSLVKTAAVDAVRRVSDDELESMRALLRPLYEDNLDKEAHMIARMELMRGVMSASGNLPVQLIARSLLQQFVPRMAPLDRFSELDQRAYRKLAKALDGALQLRDFEQISAIFDELSAFNRTQVMCAFNAYELAQQNAPQEVVAS